MNTFGLGRKINTFWLGKQQVTDAWNEIVYFVLTIKKNIQFLLER